MSNVSINGANLSVRHYNATPVITFEEVDMVHQRSAGSSRRNFSNNAQHLVEGVDYYSIPLNKYRDMYDHNYLRRGGNPTLRKILLTITGYCLLAKTFNDDLSWDIQRALVANYFNAEKDKGDIYAYLRQTVDIMESQAKAIDSLQQQVDVINSSIEQTKHLQLELLEQQEPEKLMNSAQVAAELRLYSKEKRMPHQMLVKAIAAQAGIRVNANKQYEDDCVKIERTTENTSIDLVIVNVLFKPTAVRRIKEMFESIKDYAYFENFYQKKSKYHQPGDLKNRGYRIGKRNYYIA